MNWAKSINLKKLIKVGTILFGFALIVFMSFFSATFDFLSFDWSSWLANSSILVGIMIFGILMGTSIGEDFQKEKVVSDENGKIIGGRFQRACQDYENQLVVIGAIKTYFSQFWLWYKAKQLKEKKIEFLVDNQFDSRVATIIINAIEKEDLEIGKLGYDENKPFEKIFVKDKVKLKKLNLEQLELVKSAFKMTLDTFGESYYLSLFDDGIENVKEVEKGKAIHKKIISDKKNAFILKIVSSLIISIVWSALTIKEFVDSGDSGAMQQAWLNLLSRVSALITSFVSGYSTSVVNVRDQANAIENKTNILNEFNTCYNNKTFIPETYEQMIEREYQEQKVVESLNEKCENDNAIEVVADSND